MKLLPIEHQDLPQYKADMQETFQLGAIEGNYDGDCTEIILPEADIDHSLHTQGAVAYKVIDDNGHILGGAIVVIDEQTQHNHLDFLYVKHGVQSRGIGKFIWSEMERLYPQTQVWETCTPYFEQRNIHFYVNVCGFHIVEYFNTHHPDPQFPNDSTDTEDSGMFRFEKQMFPQKGD